MSGESCLVTRLGRYVELTPDERAFLARMEESERKLGARQVVINRGQRTDGLHVLKRGWAIVRSRSVRGRSHILRIYLPGEVMGLGELGTQTAPHTISMHTEGVVCPFPREGLAELMARAPRLSALLHALSSIDQIALRDQCAALGLMTAEDRLIQWLLQLHARLCVANEGMGDRFRLPFSQAEIGDAVGMTPVYVNKLLRKLTEEGRLRIERPDVILLDREGLVNQVDFADVFAEIDHSWFPAAA
jgi:CRP-like cAMP-binding protein